MLRFVFDRIETAYASLDSSRLIDDIDQNLLVVPKFVCWLLSIENRRMLLKRSLKIMQLMITPKETKTNRREHIDERNNKRGLQKL